MENREDDKNYSICTTPEGGRRSKEYSVDLIKSLYIASGYDLPTIAKKTGIDTKRLQVLADKHKLPELRKAYILEGLQEIKNIQLQQAENLLDIENNFKKLRILQLQSMLEGYLAYYKRHGSFDKINEKTGEVLVDVSGMPLQIRIPDVAKELKDLRESINTSEGIKAAIGNVEALLNPEETSDFKASELEGIIDADFSELFEESE